MGGRVTTPRELFAARLRQMLWVELRLAEEVLPRFLDETRATGLRFGFQRHLLETRDHADALRAVLDELQVPADPQESPAFEGLVREHARRMKEVVEDGHLLSDLVHAHAASAAEHLELAAYDPLVSLAEALDEESIAIRLREVMEQEEFALEQVERATARLLAEQVESERL